MFIHRDVTEARPKEFGPTLRAKSHRVFFPVGYDMLSVRGFLRRIGWFRIFAMWQIAPQFLSSWAFLLGKHEPEAFQLVSLSDSGTRTSYWGLFYGHRLHDTHIPSFKGLSIQASYGKFTLCLDRHLHEAVASGLAAADIIVIHHRNCRNRAKGQKHTPQLSFSRFQSQIPDEYSHVVQSLPPNSNPG